MNSARLYAIEKRMDIECKDKEIEISIIEEMFNNLYNTFMHVT